MMNDINDILKNKQYIYLTETDFYPPSDDRVLTSFIEDIDDGDNFADYCEYVFEIYEEENFWD